MKPHVHVCRIPGCPAVYACTCDNRADLWGPTICGECAAKPTFAAATPQLDYRRDDAA